MELEVLRQRQSTVLPPASVNPGSTASASVKKRVIDWPQDFVPGTSATTVYDSLDLPAFVAGYLVMIKHYDTEVNKSMPAIFELLMVKATSYSWHSVRGFYSYVARQVEQRRLEWESIEEIREMASIFFKHSDLRSAKINPLRPPPPQQTNSNPGEQIKSGQAWKYRGSCTCDF